MTVDSEDDTDAVGSVEIGGVLAEDVGKELQGARKVLRGGHGDKGFRGERASESEGCDSSVGEEIGHKRNKRRRFTIDGGCVESVPTIPPTLPSCIPTRVRTGASRCAHAREPKWTN